MNVKKIINRVEYWFRYEFRYYHKHFATGVKNLWRWFPTIWKDRDWDDYYIWIILEKKLIYQAKLIGTKGIHLNAKRDAERMMTCVRLIQKVREEWYHMEHMDYHKSEYHWDDIPGDPDHKQLRIEQISERYDEYFKKYPLQFKKLFNSEKADYLGIKFDRERLAMYIARENHKRAKALLFKMLNEYIEQWWD